MRLTDSFLVKFFLRTTDKDVLRYLKMFTFLPAEELERVYERHQVCLLLEMLLMIFFLALLLF
jgi:tyrosyl-tRNA synthetase